MQQAAQYQELKRGGPGPWLALTAFIVRNRFANWTFFLSTFLIGILGMLTSAVVFYTLGQLVAPGAAPYVERYGFTYGGYIITGVALDLLMRQTLIAYHLACLNGYWGAQFDVYLQHPGGVSSLLVGNVIWAYVEAGLSTLIYVLVGVGLFGIGVSLASVPAALFILLLAVLSLTRLGLAGASTFTLLGVKRGTNPVELVVGFLATLTAGLYFPPDVLPRWLQALGEWLPQTHALRAARLVLGGRAGLGDAAVRADLAYLALFAAATLPIGVLLFGLGLHRAQREGSLTRWS